jgi:hypothetical protein
MDDFAAGDEITRSETIRRLVEVGLKERRSKGRGLKQVRRSQ